MDFIPNEDALSKMFRSNPNQHEIEARLGRFDNRGYFLSGVSKMDFDYVKETLENMSVGKKGGSLEIETSHTKVFPSKDVMKIKDLESERPPFYARKKRITTIDQKDWNYRIAQSLETNIRPDTVESTAFPDDVYRIKKRTSFIDRDNENGLFYGTRIDLTEVTQVNKNKTFKTYEVEMERITKMSSDDFMDAFIRLYAIWQKLNKTYSLHHQNILLDKLTGQSEQSSAIGRYNNLLGDKETQFIKKYRNEPKNIKIQNLFEPHTLAVTCKLDGLRKMIFIDKEGSYMINPPNEMVQIGPGSKDYDGTIIDSELVGNSLYCFDILRYKTKNVETRQLKDRLKLIDEIVKNSENMFDSKFSLFLKKFHMEKNFYQSVEKALEDCSNVRNDGLIIQSMNKPYINDMTYKWKPSQKLTIDFTVQLNGEEGVLFTMFKWRDEEPTEKDIEEIKKMKGKYTPKHIETHQKLREFKGTLSYPFNKTVTFKDGKFKDENVDGRIIEFKWSSSKNNFIPIRFRDDRPIPNFEHVAKNVWKDIQNPIEESTIRGKDLVVMRKFHNLVKTRLLEKYVPSGSTILDIGTGRGGDLAKWRELNYNVVGIEPEKKNIEEIKKRMEAMKITGVDIIHAGAEETAKIESVIESVGAIIGFFSLTFFSKNEEMMDGLVRTIDSLLDPRGVFIGTVLDGRKVRGLMKEETVYETEAFKFEKGGDWNETPFGNELVTTLKDKTSMVKDTKEYLFDFEDFEKRLEKIGISIIDGYEKSFIDKGIDELPKDSQTFSKLNRILVFRRDAKQRRLPQPVEGLTKQGIKQAFPTKFGELYRRSAITGNSSLVHAIVQSYSKKYNSTTDRDGIEKIDKELLEIQEELASTKNQKKKQALQLQKRGLFAKRDKLMNHDKKTDYVKKIREKLAFNISEKEFKKLGGGKLAQELTKDFEGMVKNKSDAGKAALSKFQLMLSDSNEYLSDNLEVIQAISDILEVNVFLFDDRHRPYLPKGEGKLTNKQKCEMLYKERPSIILLKIHDHHYEVVGTDTATVFKFDKPMIQQIYKKLC